MKAQLERVPIESFCRTVTSGGTPSRANSRFWEDGVIPWFKTAELKDWYVEDAEENISEEGLTNSAAKIFPANTLLMAMYGDGKTITSLGILRNEAATNQACCALIADPSKCHFLYLFYALKYHRHELLKLVVAGAQRNLSGGIIRKFKIFSRELPVQQRIAETLCVYDELMENNRRRIGLLEEAARLVYREWFVRLRFPGHEHACVTHGIPDGWEKCCISVFGDVITGKTPSTKESDNYGGDIPFIKTPDMHGNVFVIATETSLTEKGANTQPGKYIPPGTLLVSCIGTIGVVSLTSARSQFNQQINALIVSEECFRYFCFFALKDLKEQMEALGGGATMANVNKTKFEGLEILKPTMPLLREFHEFCNPLIQQIKVLQLQNQKLRAARDLLLPRVMSGEFAL